MTRIVVFIALLAASSATAWAVQWYQKSRMDPFTGTRNISVLGEGDDGGGVIVTCYEGRLGVALILNTSFGHEGELGRFRDSAMQVPYRIRVGHHDVMAGETPSASVESRGGYIVLPVAMSSAKRLAEGLAAAKRVVYQFAPPRGRVYRMALSGAKKTIGRVIATCRKQQLAGVTGLSASGSRVSGESGVGDAVRSLERGAASLSKRNTLDGRHVCAIPSGPRPTRAQARRYLAALSRAVEQNWLRPPGVSGAVHCAVEVKQSRFGDVLSVHMLGNCGSDSLNLSVKNAVRRASPLPLPANCALFMSRIVVDFSEPGT